VLLLPQIRNGKAAMGRDIATSAVDTGSRGALGAVRLRRDTGAWRAKQ